VAQSGKYENNRKKQKDKYTIVDLDKKYKYAAYGAGDHFIAILKIVFEAKYSEKEKE
jgi:hypothetical protein